MASESMLRLALVGLLVAFLPVAAYHRIRSHTGEPLRRTDEGLAVLIVLRLCGLGFWLGMMAELFAPRWMDWSRVDLPLWLRWAGLPLGVLAAAWTTWMFRALGRNLTDTVTVRAHATLVTTGPYRWVRHPFYLGVITMMVAVSLLSGSGFFAAAGGLALALLSLRTRTEEAKLEERFGEAYRDYKRRTGFLLPRLH